jgi:hypothetical protein
MDVALVTLPVNSPHRCIEVIRRDRLVVRLRRDELDLQDNLTILYHPERAIAASTAIVDPILLTRALVPPEFRALTKIVDDSHS